MTSTQPPLNPEELVKVADLLFGHTMPDNFRVMVEALFRQTEWQGERLTEADSFNHKMSQFYEATAQKDMAKISQIMERYIQAERDFKSRMDLEVSARLVAEARVAEAERLLWGAVHYIGLAAPETEEMEAFLRKRQ